LICRFAALALVPVFVARMPIRVVRTTPLVRRRRGRAGWGAPIRMGRRSWLVSRPACASTLRGLTCRRLFDHSE